MLLYFNSFVPIAQQAGHAVVQGRLSHNVRLWIGRYTPVKLAIYWSYSQGSLGNLEVNVSGGLPQ